MIDQRFRSKIRVLALILAALVLFAYISIWRQENRQNEDLRLHFVFEPVERFDLGNVKYSWVLTGVVVVALTIAIS